MRSERPTTILLERSSGRRSRVGRRWVLHAAALVLLTGLLVPAFPAAANHETNRAKGLEEIGFHNLGAEGENQPGEGDGYTTDVWAWTRGESLYAVSGTWGSLIGDDPCPSETDNPANPQKSGVKVVDATDPANPVMIDRLGTVPGAQNNDVKVLRMNTDGGNPDFDGHDILAHSLEPCGAELALSLVAAFNNVPREQTGFQLYDLTDPANPVQLGNYNNGGIGTHNLYAFNRPDLGRSFVLAVYNEFLADLSDLRGEAQLVDITDPNNPALVSTWELADAEAQGGPTFDELCQRRGGHLASCNLHDVWVSDDGNTAYLSFWDAGLILLDISDPTSPTYIGDIQSGGPNAEGNTHAAIPVSVDGRDLVVVGDEDFVGGGVVGSNGYKVTVNAPDSLAAEIPGMLWTNNADPDEQGVTADLVYAGTGCTQAHYAPVAAEIQGNIAIVDDRVAVNNPADRCPTYTFFQKVDAAENAGAIGLIQVVREGDEPFEGNALDSNIPAIEIPNEDGVPVRDAVIGGETVNTTISKGLVPGLPIDPWGFMRVMDVSAPNPANWEQVATFKAPHVETPDPDSQDVFSAHNPIIGPDGRIYFSWYTDGVRVLEVTGGSVNVREVAHFVPLPSDHPDDNDSDPHGVQEDNVGFWGSMAIEHPVTGELLVFNSDLNRGLYILRSRVAGGVGGTCPGGRNVSGEHVVGTPDRDLLLGTADDDVLCGLGSNDTLRGLGGDDVLLGGQGADRLIGGPGDDILRGFKQRDELRGGGGNDVLHGAQGGDRLVGAIGDDRLFGAKGHDRLIGGKGSDLCEGGPGNDRVQSCESGSA